MPEDQTPCDRCSKMLWLDDCIELNGEVLCDDCACEVADEEGSDA